MNNKREGFRWTPQLSLQHTWSVCHSCALLLQTPLVDESGESPAPLPEGLGEASPETCQKVGDIFARRMHQMKEADRIKEEEQMKENARRQVRENRSIPHNRWRIVWF